MAILGCVIFAVSILIADFVVPDHDWIADTISDLGAGRYEFIVDIGIYAFSAALIACALLCAHLHQGQRKWSAGIIGLAGLGLIVFLVGARNEYGDHDTDGVVIHSYLVYALGVLMLLVPWLLSYGLAHCALGLAKTFKVLAVLWLLFAPPFFFLPTSIDGLYERGLGLIAMAMVILLGRFFMQQGRALADEAG
ncbi:DUF998 domain-containing protein [Sulfitobacter sp. PS-8MA]|uniref:DUF998 domain-containing protein n=1 Tax=Sulfitobacter sp. PS-8MA TaxID=3237707 RepID=UPI0034C6151E